MFVLAAAASVVTLYCNVNVIEARYERSLNYTSGSPIPQIEQTETPPKAEQYIFTVNFSTQEIYIKNGLPTVAFSVMKATSLTAGQIVFETFTGMSHDPAKGLTDLTEQRIDRQTGQFVGTWTSGIKDTRTRFSTEATITARGLCTSGKLVPFPTSKF